MLLQRFVDAFGSLANNFGDSDDDFVSIEPVSNPTFNVYSVNEFMCIIDLTVDTTFSGI